MTRNPMSRRGVIALFALVGSILVAAPMAMAHHGWRWTEDGKFEITGLVAETKLGNPHGIVKLDVEGKIWTIEVGQPWRNKRAGLTDAMFAKGAEITFVGRRSAKASERVVKALRVRIKGKNYDLYPNML